MKDNYLDCSASLAQKEHCYLTMPSKRAVCFLYYFISLLFHKMNLHFNFQNLNLSVKCYFENSSLKGISIQYMKKSVIPVLEVNSRYI